MSKPEMPEVREYWAGVCHFRMVVDGVCYGYLDGEWQRTQDQCLSKQYYEKGEKV